MGALIELMVTKITPAGDQSGADGSITLVVTGMMVGGRRHPIAAEVTSMYHTLQGRRLAPEEQAAFDTPFGVVAGRVVGRDEMGTIIGGAVRPVGGTVVEFQAAGRDVVVLGGTPIVITLTAPLTIASR